MASMATDCRGGMYCLISCMLSSDPLCFLSHLAWPPTDSWVQVYIVWFSESGLHLLPDHIETRVEITIVRRPFFLPQVPDLNQREHEVTFAKWRKGAATFFFSLIII
uniref:Uncharacterized protein n=1 Tax=Triticum urartu TaxID=4572 RepID=A0A8R7U675_TRIUA